MERVWIGTKKILEDEGLLEGSEEKTELVRNILENNPNCHEFVLKNMAGMLNENLQK